MISPTPGRLLPRVISDVHLTRGEQIYSGESRPGTSASDIRVGLVYATMSHLYSMVCIPQIERKNGYAYETPFGGWIVGSGSFGGSIHLDM